jgi:hypothetical protein
MAAEIPVTGAIRFFSVTSNIFSSSTAVSSSVQKYASVHMHPTEGARQQ